MAWGTPENPFYTPGYGYGGMDWATNNPNAPGAQEAIENGGGWSDTEFVKKFLDPQIPEGVFYGFLGDRYLGGNDAMSRWAQDQYGRTLTGYKAGLRDNPNMTYAEYLKRQFNKPGLRSMYYAGTARERGENPAQFVGRTRQIGWG